jgi:hypothetical protein
LLDRSRVPRFRVTISLIMELRRERYSVSGSEEKGENETGWPVGMSSFTKGEDERVLCRRWRSLRTLATSTTRSP